MLGPRPITRVAVGTFRDISRRMAVGALRLVALVSAALLLNLHYVLLGRPFLEGPLTSRPVLAFGNFLFGKLIRLAMIKEGVPKPDRIERYNPGGRIDVYEPDENTPSPRTAVLYFHSGAFVAGHRSMGGGVCGWLASHGAVCLSASYRLTNSGAGVKGCIEDAWASFRWVKENAVRLNIDPSKIVVVGDSAGGLLATSLATGLGGAVPTGVGGEAPPERSGLPAAVVCGWPATALGAKTYVPRRLIKKAGASRAEWDDTPAAKDFEVENAFVPTEKYGNTQEETQERLRTVLAGGLLCFGRRWKGLLPAASGRFPLDDDAASVSPLRRASFRSDLPPMLLLTAGNDQVVPCEQTSRFAETAREGGNEVAQLIFEEAVHGGGGINCKEGRQAALDFLRYHELLPPPLPMPVTAEKEEVDESDPRDAIGGAMRAFRLVPTEFRGPMRYRPALHGRTTLRFKPV